jgi:hypothetical protein
MIRPRSHKAGKAESLFGDILKPFFDSIGQNEKWRHSDRMSAFPLIAAGKADVLQFRFVPISKV